MIFWRCSRVALLCTWRIKIGNHNHNSSKV